MKNAIYRIINLVNDKFYVGSTRDTRERFRQHRKLLRAGRHHCAHLQAAWNKYGESKFDFVVTATYETWAELEPAEDALLLEHHGKPYCYNTGRSAYAPWRGISGAAHPLWGGKLSEDRKQTIATGLKTYYGGDPTKHPRYGVAHTDESRAKMSANRAAPTGENHYNYGKTLDEATRKKIGDAQRGKPKGPGRVVSPEGLAKIRASAAAGNYGNFAGKKHTAEAKAKMSTPVTFTWADGRVQEFPSIIEACRVVGVHMPTLHRALKSGRPIARGPLAGCSIIYCAA